MQSSRLPASGVKKLPLLSLSLTEPLKSIAELRRIKAIRRGLKDRLPYKGDWQYPVSILLEERIDDRYEELYAFLMYGRS